MHRGRATRRSTRSPSSIIPVILATGPLTARCARRGSRSRSIGREYLAYYDAIAPVLIAESIDWDIVFKASRYDKGGDAAYGNIPLNEEEYDRFIADVIAAEKVEARDFEEVRYFEGCLPIEVMAERGPSDARIRADEAGGSGRSTDRRSSPLRSMQLRQEDAAASAYNMVGFQTRMKWPAQKRVFRSLPGLGEGRVRTARIGASQHLRAQPERARRRPAAEARGRACTSPGRSRAWRATSRAPHAGWCSGCVLAAKLNGGHRPLPPPTCALGALAGTHVREPADPKKFQPSNIVWSHFPRLPGKKIRKRRLRREALANRALEDLQGWLD